MIKGCCAIDRHRLTLPLVRFPESERVVYKQNPLLEVICQVRFQRVLRIEAEPPFAFQERVRASYPRLNEQISARVPDEVARALGVDLSSHASRTFEFLDDKNEWKLSLTSTFLSLSTRNYSRWETFLSRLIPALDALRDIYAVDRYARVGLRYQDLIGREQIGLAGRPWSACLRTQLLGELADAMFDEAATQARRELVLTLDYPASAVRLVHGLVDAQTYEGKAERCYLIDADFYTSNETERSDAEKRLDEFNKESGRLFRWCITPALHNALGPTKP